MISTFSKIFSKFKEGQWPHCPTPDVHVRTVVLFYDVAYARYACMYVID